MVQKTYLEFEKPIAALEARIQEMKLMAKEKNTNSFDDAIRALEQSLQKLKKETYDNLTPWQRVQLSRHPDRPYTMDYIRALCQEFIELHGDRQVRDDKAIVGGFGRIDQQTIMFIGHQKGRHTKERQYRNFGMANPEGYRKALRLMRLAEKFGKPIVTLIDTPGAYPGMEAEERGQGEAIARNLREMFRIRVPIICIIIGEGASGGALGIAIGDRVYMLENTWYSVISPESCSSILWRSWDFKEQAAEALKLTAKDMLSHQLIDGIIQEPLGGAHQNPQETYQRVRQVILNDIELLSQLPAEQLINSRIEKFCRMGVFTESES